MNFKSGLAVALICAFVTQPIAFAAGAAGVQTLNREARALRAAIDSGSPADVELEKFAKTIAEKNLTAADVRAFAKQRMTAREFREFQAKMDSLLKGVDPATVSGEELGLIMGEAISGSSSEGLSWSSCTTRNIGIAVAIAGAVVALIALAKQKSDEQIRIEHDKKRYDVKKHFDDEVELRQDWQTVLPEKITTTRAQVKSYQNSVDYWWAHRDYEDTNDEGEVVETGYENYEYYRGLLAGAQTRLTNFEALLARYQGNPELALVDIQALEADRLAQNTQIGSDEAQAILDAPGIRQRLGRIAIGGGIGAGVGAALILLGNRQGGCES